VITGEHVLVHDGGLLLSTGTGDVPGEDGSALGLYVGDTRLLSRWHLQLGDGELAPAAGHEEPGRRRLALLLPGLRNRPDPVLLDRSQRVDRDGLHETLVVLNTSHQTRAVTVTLTLAVDFADQFTVRSDGRRYQRPAARHTVAVLPDGLLFEYRHDTGGRRFAAASRISADPPPLVRPAPGGHELSWRVRLPPRQPAVLSLRAGPPSRPTGPEPTEPTGPTGRAGPTEDHRPPGHPAPTPGELDLVARCCAGDLDALMIADPTGSAGEPVPAAGAPWFLTLFGRDSLLTAALAGPDRPGLVAAVLRALAATQGTRDDDRSLEQPGRIVHELRSSELATLDLVPYRRYYGSVDATALFLSLLGRCAIGPEAIPGGRRLAGQLRESALAAVGWLRGPGGLDEHGFVRYRADPRGLTNQGWKDSPDSTVFADGRIAEGPIALCEVQGYTWDALTRVSQLARHVWHDPATAAELQRLADALRARFVERFWLPDKNFPALALDGQGAPVDALASNAGHLLWSGILPGPAAAAIAGRLLEPASFSGWGLRTLAAGQPPYSPLSYHNGSVWPHDTMLTALGLHRCGHHQPARRLAEGIVDCALRLGGTLPELIGGFGPAEFPEPVRYRFAGQPQAWSAAAGLAAVRLLRDGARSGCAAGTPAVPPR
jgi:glycogen debranching enzyme